MSEVYGYVSSRPCGCVEFVTVDDPHANVAYRAETLARVADDQKRGLTVERLPIDEVRKAARRMGECDACRPVEVAP